jgi:hypothetical protein
MTTPYLRQRDLLVPAQAAGFDIDLIGAGSLGGAILLGMLKMGFGERNRVRVWDGDRCEPHNLATQWFRVSDAAQRRPKVDAVSDTALWVCDREIEVREIRFTGSENTRIGPLVVLAVDSLAERRLIWTRLREREDVTLVIDARMGAEVVEVLAVELGSPGTDGYEASLAGEPVKEPCTRRAIVYTGLGAAALVCSMLRSHVRGERFSRHVMLDLRQFLIESTPPC